jgi:hypothetical protein
MERPCQPIRVREMGNPKPGGGLYSYSRSHVILTILTVFVLISPRLLHNSTLFEYLNLNFAYIAYVTVYEYIVAPANKIAEGGALCYITHSP